jgi:hypothetical protein
MREGHCKKTFAAKQDVPIAVIRTESCMTNLFAAVATGICMRERLTGSLWAHLAKWCSKNIARQ